MDNRGEVFPLVTMGEVAILQINKPLYKFLTKEYEMESSASTQN